MWMFEATCLSTFSTARSLELESVCIRDLFSALCCSYLGSSSVAQVLNLRAVGTSVF